MLLFLYRITQSINKQLTSLHKAAWRRRTRRTEKMPSRKVKMEERRKHHHFLSLRHSSSPKIGTPSPAPVSIASLIHPSFWKSKFQGSKGSMGPTGFRTGAPADFGSGLGNLTRHLPASLTVVVFMSCCLFVFLSFFLLKGSNVLAQTPFEGLMGHLGSARVPGAFPIRAFQLEQHRLTKITHCPNISYDRVWLASDYHKLCQRIL